MYFTCFLLSQAKFKLNTFLMKKKAPTNSMHSNTKKKVIFINLTSVASSKHQTLQQS
jgi:hypothetical protein